MRTFYSVETMRTNQSSRLRRHCLAESPLVPVRSAAVSYLMGSTVPFSSALTTVNYSNGASFDAWISTADSDGLIIADGGGDVNESGMGLFVESGNLVARSSTANGSSFNFEIVGPAINDGDYHHVSLTWTGDTSVDGAKLYLDGVEVGTATAAASLVTGTTPAHFGGHSTLAYDFLGGTLDEVGAYQRELTPAEIASIFSLDGLGKSDEATIIQGNVIGLDANGNALPNPTGIRVDNTGFAVIGSDVDGTTEFEEANIISGNGGTGLLLEGPSSRQNLVGDNFIGTDAFGIPLAGQPNAVVATASTSETFVNGVMTVDGAITFDAGSTLKGTGTILGAVTSGGIVAPGNSPGILNTGDFSLLAGGTLEIEIGGTTAGNTATDHDQVNVTGSVTLAGALDVQLFGAFTPSANDTFVIINNDGADSIGGTFDGLAEGAILQDGSGNNYTISYVGGDGNDVVLTATGTMTFVVVNTNDSGVGSLRQAIIDANSSAGSDRIEFDITSNEGAGPHTIAPATLLPAITDAVTINGLTETGASANTLLIGNDSVLQVILEGTQLDGTGGFAFDVQAADVEIRGFRLQDWGDQFSGGAIATDAAADNLVVAGNHIGNDGDIPFGRFAVYVVGDNATIGGSSVADRNTISQNDNGIIVADGSGTTIAGNYIGVTPDGTAGLQNGSEGVWVQSLAGNVTIDSNVISGNNSNAILITGAPNTTVTSNFLGTNASGTAAIPNAGDGIQVEGSNTTIIGNVISGNARDGVSVLGTTTNADSAIIQGNFVGTNAAGNAAIPNTFVGVRVNSAAGALIGTDGDGFNDVGERNIISGNAIHGVELDLGGNAGHIVAGNYIGTDVGGTADLGNGILGVHVVNSGGNTIGGDSPTERNVIANSGFQGVSIDGSLAENNTVSGNYIGVDATGLTPAGNLAGVHLFGTGSGNVVGGSTPSERNIIAGNTEAGVALQSFSSGNTVVGNYIGVGVDGTTTLTQLEGVEVSGGSSNNVIGGGPGEGNLIIGHTNDGIRIAGPTSTLNVVSGNTISDNGLLGVFVNGAPDNVVGTGTAATAVGLAGNTIDGNQNGVWIDGATATGNVVGGNLIGLGGAQDDGVRINNNASNNTIGGLTSLLRNVISGNTGDGIEINNSDDNVVLGNYIGTDALGATDVANAVFGVFITGGDNNIIGGGVIGAGQRHLG